MKSAFPDLKYWYKKRSQPQNDVEQILLKLIESTFSFYKIESL